MIRVALHRKSDSRYPIEFRPDCERTYFEPVTGKDETLVQVIERLDRQGYDLISYVECQKLFDSQGKRKEPK